MQNVIKCSFCQKPQGMLRNEIASPGTLIVSICPDCLNVCRGILRKETRSGADPGSYRVSSSRREPDEPLCCSFCDTPQHIVDKLIGSPPGRTPAYICDKCVAVGAGMVEAGFSKNLWRRIARKFRILALKMGGPQEQRSRSFASRPGMLRE